MTLDRSENLIHEVKQNDTTQTKHTETYG
jgi:hypothetical protein